MNRRAIRVYVVQLISCIRLVAALIFAWLAFKETFRLLVLYIYICAMISDAVDGFLSRQLGATTYFGKVIDLIADKSLTMVSLLYGAARGIDIAPLALIAMRDLLMIGMRLVMVDEVPLLPSSRIFGGLMATLVWGNTLFLIYVERADLVVLANDGYWICAMLFMANLAKRIYKSGKRIRIAATR